MPPASGSSRSRHASTCTRRMPRRRQVVDVPRQVGACRNVRSGHVDRREHAETIGGRPPVDRRLPGRPGACWLPCRRARRRRRSRSCWAAALRLASRSRRLRWRAVVARRSVVLAIALPLRGLYKATGSSMEEGFMLVFPRLVQPARCPTSTSSTCTGRRRSTCSLVWYRIFGDSLESERTFGLLQHLGIIFAVYALARVAGHLAATGAALVATRADPDADRAVGAGLARRRRARPVGGRVRRARPPRRPIASSDWWWAGGLAGPGARASGPTSCWRWRWRWGSRVWRRREQLLVAAGRGCSSA